MQFAVAKSKSLQPRLHKAVQVTYLLGLGSCISQLSLQAPQQHYPAQLSHCTILHNGVVNGSRAHPDCSLLRHYVAGVSTAVPEIVEIVDILELSERVVVTGYSLFNCSHVIIACDYNFA